MGGTTSGELYRSCCKKSLVESLISAKLLKDIYGYDNTDRFIKETIRTYNTRGRVDEDYSTVLVKNLTLDLDNDQFLRGLEKHDAESYNRGKKSIERTLGFIKNVFSGLSVSFDEQLSFILYFDSIGNTCDSFDFDKLEMNRRRVIDADKPQDIYHALKDQYKQIYEEIYRPYSRDLSSVIARYPGFDQDTGYIAMENLLSVYECYDTGSEYKSDVREIRNALSHEKYSIGKNLTLTFKDGSRHDYDVKEMMFMISMMQYKCMYVNTVLPIMNVEVLRTMSLRF